MKAAGVLRGAYQFFEPGEDATAQANLMVSKVGVLQKGDLPCMIDVETTGGESASTIASRVRTWLDIVEKGTGKVPVIYTGPYFWDDNVRDTSFGHYPLWVADYGPSCPLVPNGWSSWTLWQYSDGGGKLDHDVFNGSLSAFDAWAGASVATPSAPSGFTQFVNRTPVDVDGDGKNDVCARAAAGIVCELSDGAGFPTAVRGPAWSDSEGWSAAQYANTIVISDVNGDGKTDVCGRAHDGMHCYLSDGKSFPTEITGPAWSDAEGWSKPQYYETITLADVNGDGRADLCARAAAGIRCQLSTGSGFSTEVVGPAWSDAEGWSVDEYYTTIQFGDINGDKRADVCARAAAGIRCYLSNGSSFPTEVVGPAWSNAEGWEKPEYGSTVRLADVNGDGSLDICARAAAGVVCALSDGKAFPTAVTGPKWSDAEGWAKVEYYSTIQFLDVDGDGKADACARAAAGMVCALSNGTSFPTSVQGPGWSDKEGWAAAEYYTTIAFADVDGDGKTDLCARAAAGIVCGRSKGTSFSGDFAGPAWSNAEGWSKALYYGSIRY